MSVTIISVSLILTMLVTATMGRNHPDCDQHKVIKNFQRMCKSYAMWKRSTPNQFIQGDFGNGIGQWQPNNFGGFVPYGAPWWWYPQSGGRQNGVIESQFYSGPENLDPIYGEEVLATLERWRRNKDVEEQLEKFIRYQCCTNGCPFPGSYFEIEKSTNICTLR